MAGGGKGANLRRERWFRDCWRSAFLAGTGVTCSMTGRGAARDSHSGTSQVITLDTVKKHVSHLLSKLGATNRTEAVTRALQLSLIP